DAYIAAIATEIAAEFAAKNGLAAPSAGQSPIGAALALRAAVEGLPELRSRTAAPPPSPPVPQPPPSNTGTRTAADDTLMSVRSPLRTTDVDDHRDHERTSSAREPPSFRRSPDLDPVSNALMRDVQSLDLARMPQHQFRIWAEELAARARALQDK